MPGKLIAAALLCALLPAAAAADGEIRCGTKLVERGMTKAEVRRLCDEPAVIEQNKTVWIYDRGPDELLKIITFVEGKVDFIDERSRADPELP